MTVDSCLFDACQRDRVPVLRIYSWTPAAFSLGVNQNPEDIIDLRLCRKEGIGVVKRMTGGEAIFHDDELTYSVVAPLEDLGCGTSVKKSYKRICGCIINAYKRVGLSADFSCDSMHEFAGRQPLCFASRQEYDIIIAGKKIGGNAQKRSRDVILQHGSIPFTFDIEKIKRYLRADITDMLRCSAPLCAHTEDGDIREKIKNALIEAFADKFPI